MSLRISSWFFVDQRFSGFVCFALVIPDLHRQWLMLRVVVVGKKKEFR